MSMIALSGTRTSSVNVRPSGLANAWTVTSRGMSWADTFATDVTETRRNRAATCAALVWNIDLLGGVGPRPDHALVLFRHRSHAPVDELLETLSFPRLRRVQIALRVDRDAVHAVELARLSSAIAECRDLLQRLAIDDPHDVVHAVGHEDVFLLCVLR